MHKVTWIMHDLLNNIKQYYEEQEYNKQCGDIYAQSSYKMSMNLR